MRLRRRTEQNTCLCLVFWLLRRIAFDWQFYCCWSLFLGFEEGIVSDMFITYFQSYSRSIRMRHCVFSLSLCGIQRNCSAALDRAPCHLGKPAAWVTYRLQMLRDAFLTWAENLWEYKYHKEMVLIYSFLLRRECFSFVLRRNMKCKTRLRPQVLIALKALKNHFA